MAQSEATREALWLRKVAADLGLDTGAILIGQQHPDRTASTM
jgi:hypothetical protein